MAPLAAVAAMVAFPPAMAAVAAMVALAE